MTLDLQAAKEACERAPRHILTSEKYRGGEYQGTTIKQGCEEFYDLARSALPACIAEVERLRALLLEVCETAADLNEAPNDAWRGAVERTSTRNRIEEIDAIARGVVMSDTAGSAKP